MKDTFNLIYVLFALLLLALLLLVRCSSKTGGARVVRDTIVITRVDTLAVERERIRERTRVEYVTLVDTFYTSGNSDTIAITAPIERKQYRDTLGDDSAKVALFVAFHGAFAGLDSVAVEVERKEVHTTETRRKRWTHGIYATGGVGYDVLHNSPYLGVGIGYGFGYSFGR